MEQKLVQKSTVFVHTYLLEAGADPGFPVGGAPTLQEGHQHTIFLKNCMKLRKFWFMRGGGGTPLDPPLVNSTMHLYNLARFKTKNRKNKMYV